MDEPTLPDGLRAWAGTSGPAAVLDAIRRRVSRGGGLESGSLSVSLTPEQRTQVARLLGTGWEVSNKAVTLRALGRALAEHGLTVRQFVELFDGRKLTVRREAQALKHIAAEEERRNSLRILRAVGIAEHVGDGWLAGPRAPRLGSGAAAEMARQIARVWPRLPWDGPGLRLAQLAAGATEDAHGLDYSTDLGRTVARLIAASTGLARPSRPGREWRAAWASAGVRCDTVSSRVLTLNVPLDFTAGHRRGAPTWLTLRDLLGPWRFDPVPARLFVCENPTIVEAAADELGPRCPPLVCTDGVPALAALDLIAGIDESRTEVRVRADIDPTGFMIVSAVQSAARRASLWRFDTATYATYFGIDVESGVNLVEARAAFGKDLHEEAVLPLLLSDLRDAADRLVAGN
ncbi:TIGR02679 domain-containing protein [Nocardia sp. CA-128927]|uniref:TIGR02679 domain-containing protein n=1 Tax=Nocardia sp. CA-128927 TaxID=3239975 RepID=UPI003D96E6CA